MKETPEHILSQIDDNSKLKSMLESEVKRYERVIIDLKHKLKQMGYPCE